MEQEIDWDEREKELIEPRDQYRKTDGSYDCIVGRVVARTAPCSSIC